jgi:plasmid stabilization system protein ParE
MARSRRYHPLVADDLTAAIAYYAAISPELGNRFRASIRSCFNAVTDRPEFFGIVHEHLRAARLSRFPYVILFEYVQDNDLIHVVGIFHAASDRGRWFERSLG